GPALGPAVRQGIVRRSAGLPLFLVELARAGGDALPANLRIAVRQQLADLPEPAAAALRRIASADVAVPIEALAAGAADAAATERLLDALEAAVRRRILEDTTHGFRFRHPV